MNKYTFFEDPGHGWLKVPMTELVDLGVAGMITSCSYRDDTHAYLEEDCDMTSFLVAKLTGQPPADWKEASMRLGVILEDAKAWYASNVDHNDRAALRGAPEIFVRRLPSYSAKPFH
jgi:hypothetical protein